MCGSLILLYSRRLLQKMRKSVQATSSKPEIGIRPGMQVQRYKFSLALQSTFDDFFRSNSNFFQRAEKHLDGWVLGWVFGGVFGGVFERHPPFNFSLFIGISRDLGGCWGVFAKNLSRIIIPHSRSEIIQRKGRIIKKTAESNNKKAKK